MSAGSSCRTDLPALAPKTSATSLSRIVRASHDLTGMGYRRACRGILCEVNPFLDSFLRVDLNIPLRVLFSKPETNMAYKGMTLMRGRHRSATASRRKRPMWAARKAT